MLRIQHRDDVDMLTRSKARRTDEWVSDVNGEMERREQPAEQLDDGEQILSDGSSTLHSNYEDSASELQSLKSHTRVPPSPPGSYGGRASSAGSRASTLRRKLQRATRLAEAERQMAEKARKREKEERRRDEEELARVRRLVDLEEQLAEEEELEPPSMMSGESPRERFSPPQPEKPIATQASSIESIDQRSLAQEIADAFQAKANLPKQELAPFSGKACDYNRFIHAFETTIEQSSLPLTKQAKLGYLVQFCNGDAKKCIEDCILLPPEEGYRKAKELLLANFGRPWTIAEDFVRRLTEGPAIKANDHAALRALCLDLTKCELNLSQIGFKEHLDGPQTIRSIVHRLPYAMRSKWAELAHRKTSKGKIVSIRDLTEFVREREMIAASLYGRELRDDKSRSNEQPKKKDTKTASRAATFTTSEEKQRRMEKRTADARTTVAPASPTRCPGCQGTCRNVADCPTYAQLAYGDRKKLILEHKLCYNCLKPAHMAAACYSPSQCNVPDCKGKHHHTLHQWRPMRSEDQGDKTSSAGGYLTASSAGRVLLGIVPVRVRGANGKDVVTNALLDNGSSQCFCSEELRRQLGIKGKEVQYTLSTLTAANVPSMAIEVTIDVQGMRSASPVRLNSVWSVPELRVSLDRAVRPEDLDMCPHLQDLRIDPPVGDHVGLLIGASSPVLVPIDVRCPPSPGLPYAELTPLGWVVRGPTPAQSRPSRHHSVHWSHTDPLETSLERMWRTEFADNLACTKTGLSLEDKEALTMMEESVKHDGKHYEICLPWRDGQPCLPNNRFMAEKRLQSLKRRLSRDQELLEGYTRQMDSYLKQGHAAVGAVLAEEHSTWYLPHHPVIHPAKPGKVRIVYDGAATHRGISINNRLLSGPDLTNDLVGVLIRFRQHHVALCADIEAMFMQIAVTPRDRSALHFLWWPEGDLSRPPEIHHMTRHVFGLTSSPACATFALQRTAKDFGSSYMDLATKTVNRNFYVDDLLTSLPSIKEASKLATDLKQMVRQGGFNLTKWTSNEPAAIRHMMPDDLRSSSGLVPLYSPAERALGLQWHTDSDVFSFDARIPERPCTKRGILSAVSSIYDPLGLISPMILAPKLLLQELSRHKVSWDDPIPPNMKTKWEAWLESAEALCQLKFSRCFTSIKAPAERQLHIFCDASELGYGACAYLRCQSEGEITVSLVLGKARLAPMHQVSIPRLELAAAALASQVRKQVMDQLDVTVDRIFMWTDSMIALGYIRNRNRRFKTYVANRLAIVHENSDIDDWRHVPSAENPADLASRGITASNSDEVAFWQQGPAFLLSTEKSWPKQPSRHPEVDQEDPEAKAEVLMTDGTHDNVIGRFSAWNRAQRVVAWMLRFRSASSKQDRVPGPLTLSELKAAEHRLLNITQEAVFRDELLRVRKGQPVLADSQLAALAPKIRDEILVMGGRAPPWNRPILPSSSHLTTLIVRHHHARQGHAGVEQTLAAIRTQWWIVHGRSAVKKVLRECRICRRWRSDPVNQMMGPLRQEQLHRTHPFVNVGVDYFGPFMVKIGRSRQKRYVCIFTCLVMRAVHLEVSHAMTTDSFLAAFTRFVARRGCPAKIFSDNGTNFVGAEKELERMLRGWSQEEITATMQQHDIEWHFNPPSSSHKGGLWERLIRSVRRILAVSLRDQATTEEGLVTLMAEVERILNDRPLTPVSDDPKDLRTLTPNDLLLLRGAPNLIPAAHEKEHLSRRWWRQAQRLADVFWTRWLREYVPLLHQRQKWRRPTRNFKVGDLVLVVDNTPRGQWPLGLVTAATPSTDGLVRSCEVRCGSKSYRRPVTKLCLLEADVDDDGSGSPATPKCRKAVQDT